MEFLFCVIVFSLSSGELVYYTFIYVEGESVIYSADMVIRVLFWFSEYFFCMYNVYLY